MVKDALGRGGPEGFDPGFPGWRSLALTIGAALINVRPLLSRACYSMGLMPHLAFMNTSPAGLWISVSEDHQFIGGTDFIGNAEVEGASTKHTA